MLSLNRIFHNSPDLPLIRRELMLITARCGLTGAMQVSSKMDRSMLVLQISVPRKTFSTGAESEQAGQQENRKQGYVEQAPTWASSAALCDRIVDMQVRDDRIYLRGQRYRFELDVLAFALHGPAENSGSQSENEPRAKLKQREIAPMKFDELIFVGDSNKCVSQALRCAQLAQKIVVHGARQREHSQRVAQQCLARLQGHQTKSLKEINL